METFRVRGRKLVRKRELRGVFLLLLLHCSVFAQRKHPKKIRASHLILLHPPQPTHVHTNPEEDEFLCAHAPDITTPIRLAAHRIDRSASQTQSHKGWPRFQHMQTQACCTEKYLIHM